MQASIRPVLIWFWHVTVCVQGKATWCARTGPESARCKPASSRIHPVFIHNGARTSTGTIPVLAHYGMLAGIAGWNNEYLAKSVLKDCSHSDAISMARCKTAATLVLTHWSYLSLALCHRIRMVFLHHASWCPSSYTKNIIFMYNLPA